MKLLCWLLLFGTLTANAADSAFPVYYFSSTSLERAIEASPKHTSDRYLLTADTSWLAPALAHFPLAVYTLGKLLHRSDDNCTHAPDQLLGTEVWNACRRHDYCLADLADYSGKADFKDAFKACNRGLRNNLGELCHDQSHILCHQMKDIYYLAVAEFPVDMRSFISEQNKQALFLADLLRTRDPRLSEYMDVSEAKRRLNSFCEMNVGYLKNLKKDQTWKNYVTSPHDEVPAVPFRECEEFEGGLIPKALPGDPL